MIDVASYISELLYKRDSVALPGIGTISCTYQEAVIDYVQGMLYPPSKSLTLDEQLITDDQVLVMHLVDALKIEVEDAQRVVDAFVFNTLQALEKREIILLPNVGRMYRDYENRLQFLQDNTNFNKDSFGLQPVQFYPILRNKSKLYSEAPIPVDKRVELPKDPWYERLRTQLRPAAAAMLSIALLLLAFTIYFAKSSQTGLDGVQKMPVSDNRLNQKPTDQYASVFDGLFGKSDKAGASQPVLPEAEVEIDEPEEEFYTELDTEAITTAPNQKEAVIIIGAFSRKKGVEKRIKQIYELGYDAYQDQFNGLTRVGAQFSFEHDAQVREVLRLMRKRFDKSAYVLDM